MFLVSGVFGDGCGIGIDRLWGMFGTDWAPTTYGTDLGVVGSDFIEVGMRNVPGTIGTFGTDFGFAGGVGGGKSGTPTIFLEILTA